MWRFGHLADPCKTQVDHKVDLYVKARTPSQGLGRARTVHEPYRTSTTIGPAQESTVVLKYPWSMVQVYFIVDHTHLQVSRQPLLIVLKRHLMTSTRLVPEVSQNFKVDSDYLR